MAKATTKQAAPRMSDEAVKAKTGKTWKEWFAILDKAGASELSHQGDSPVSPREARRWPLVATDGGSHL
jgi:hypothetical protein